MSAVTTTRTDWDVPESPRTGLALPLGAPIALAVALGLVVALALSVPAGLAAAALVAGGFLAWVASRGRAALRQLQASEVETGTEPRYENLVAGLADDLGAPAPGLWTIPDRRPNALVVWAGGPQVALTEGALKNLTRTEMEAVVAHCMVRIASGEARRATIALGLGSLGRSLVRVGHALDVRAVALTRYPPALAAALRKCDPIESLEPLWMVATGPTHAGREDRAEALLDL